MTEDTKARRKYWPHLIWLALIAVAVGVVYKDLPRSTFFLDDFLHLHLIERFKSGFEPFINDVFMGAFFRPAITFFWMLDHLVYGINPTGYYLSNIIYLFISSVLLFMLLQNMTGSYSISGIISALYAVGPVTGIGVMWLSNRFDLIGTLLFLASTLLFLRYVRFRRPMAYLWSVFLGTLAYFCKEITITLPVILVLASGFMFLYRAPQTFNFRLIKRLISLSTPYFTIAVIYMIWRFAVIKSLGGYVGEQKEPLTLGYFFFLWNCFGDYLWLIKNFFVFIVLTMLLIVLLVKKNFYASNKLFFFGILFTVITAFPLVMILRYRGVMSYMTPRFFFLPNIGALIVLASMYDPRGGRARRALAGVILALVGVSMALNNYILVHKWMRDKQKLTAKTEQVDQFMKNKLSAEIKDGIIYTCMYGLDVALDSSIKLMHPEYLSRYYFLNCTGPTQSVATNELFQQYRRFINYPQTFARNPCEYNGLLYGVVDTRPTTIPQQMRSSENVAVLHYNKMGDLTSINRNIINERLRTLGILQ